MEMDSRRQYVQAVKKVLIEEYSSPSVAMVRFFANRVCSTPTEQVIDQFAPIVKEAFREVLCEKITDGVFSGLSENPIKQTHHVMSDEEFEGFFVVNVA